MDFKYYLPAVVTLLVSIVTIYINIMLTKKNKGTEWLKELRTHFACFIGSLTIHNKFELVKNKTAVVILLNENNKEQKLLLTMVNEISELIIHYVQNINQYTAKRIDETTDKFNLLLNEIVVQFKVVCKIEQAKIDSIFK